MLEELFNIIPSPSDLIFGRLLSYKRCSFYMRVKVRSRSKVTPRFLQSSDGIRASAEEFSPKHISWLLSEGG